MPAIADRAIDATVLAQSGSAVRLERCALSIDGTVVDQSYDFTNTSKIVVTDVELIIVFKDAFGGINGFSRHVSHGPYSIDTPIRDVKFKNTSSQYVDSASCTVSRVKFVGGSVWSAGKGFLDGAIPSTRPSPSPSPAPAASSS